MLIRIIKGKVGIPEEAKEQLGFSEGDYLLYSIDIEKKLLLLDKIDKKKLAEALERIKNE